MIEQFKRLTSSLYVKILFGFTAILLFSLVLGYGTLDQLRTIDGQISALSPQVDTIETLSEMNATIEILRSRTITIERWSKEDTETLIRQLEKDQSQVSKNLASDDANTQLSSFSAAVKKTVQVSRFSIMNIKAGKSPDTDQVEGSLDEARMAVDVLSQFVQESSSANIQNERSLLAQAMRQLLTTQVIVLFLGMLLAMFLARMITSPLEILKESVLGVARGDYGAQVAIRSSDELGELATAFNEMSHALKKYTTSLEGEVHARTKELDEKVDALNILTKELDESAQMLVRRDVALTRATERLQELDLVKSEFLSVAAHQLRTPLSAIKWTLSLLLDGDVGPVTDDQKELFHKAAQSNERMIRLIDDMLTVTRIESGKTTFVTAPVLVGDVLKSSVDEVRRTAEDKGIHLVFDTPPEHRSVALDTEKFSAVFQNLLENAIRYTPSGGTITARLEQRPHDVSVTIADTGIGIPEKQQANIFSKFFRADNAVKTVTDGTGLGLYVAKTIVERHRGTLRFESQEGKGTTFFITLPNESAPFHGNPFI